MRKCIDLMKANPWLTKRLAVLVMVVVVGAGSFWFGRRQSGVHVTAGGSGDKDGDANTRAVAYVYNNIPVTRAEFGDYLINRLGVERLEFMINRKIVEMECTKHNIVATDMEVQARFLKDVESFSGPTKLTPVEFVNNVLRKFGKTEYEWREDVIRPKILMEKLVQSSVKITENDLREGFEARFGPKAECRMIVIDKGQRQFGLKVWENARKGQADFLVEATKQFIPSLASVAGKVPPIHKHFGDQQLEDAAFALKAGEISPLLEMKDGTYVILLCEKQLPANAAERFVDHREKLIKEMHELRVAQRIPEAFAKLRQDANPRPILANQVQHASYQGPPTMPVSQARNLEPTTLPPVKMPEFKPMAIVPNDGQKVVLPDAPLKAPDINRPPVDSTPPPARTPTIEQPPMPIGLPPGVVIPLPETKK